jgi:hypothetical protein
MKRLWIIGLAMLFTFGLCSSALAGWPAIGSPSSMPKKGKFIVGVEHTAVTGWDADYDSPQAGARGCLKHVGSNAECITLSYGILDRLSIKARVGGQDFRAKDDTQVSAEFDYGFVGGIGIKYLALKEKKTGLKLALGSQYSETHPKDATASDDGRDTDLDVIYWDVSCALGRDFEIPKLHKLTPYIGVKYAEAKGDFTWSSPTTGVDYNYHVAAKHNLGYFTGVDVDFTERLFANLEGGWGHQESITIGLNYRF